MTRTNHEDRFLRRAEISPTNNRGTWHNMSHRMIWLVAHVVLLALASTSFTIVTGLRDGQFQWQYFQYTWQQGWGLPYQFPYSFAVVLCYMAAYATGTAAYYGAYRAGSHFAGLTGIVLCGAGLASFAFELTHWLIDHYQSWIISTPVVLLGLAVVTAIQDRLRLRARLPGNDESDVQTEAHA